MSIDLTALINGMTSRSENKRTRSEEKLRTLLCDRQAPTPAAAAAIPLLVTLASQSKTPDPAAILRLAADALCGEHVHSAGAGPSEQLRSWQTEHLADKAAIARQLVVLLGGEASVRAAAALVLGLLVTAEGTAEPLAQALSRESDPWVATTMIIALGILAPGHGALEALRDDARLVVREAVAVARLPLEPDLDVMPFLQRGMVAGDLFPWCGGAADAVAVRRVRALQGDGAGLNLLLRAIKHPGVEQQDAAEWAHWALRLQFEEQGQALDPADLSAPQQTLLEALSEADYQTCFSDFGVPDGFRLRRRWLGLAPPGVLEQRVTVDGKTLPLWAHHDRLGKKLWLATVKDRLAPGERLAALAESYDPEVPHHFVDMREVADAYDDCTDDERRRWAETFLPGYLAAKLASNRPEWVKLARPLAATAAGILADALGEDALLPDDWAELMNLYAVPEPRRALARRLPSGQLETLVLQTMAERAKRPDVGLPMLAPVIEYCCTDEIQERLLAMLTHPRANRVVAGAVTWLERAPELAPLLADYRAASEA